MLQFFTIITTITGIFTILDLFVEKNAKNKVAEYVFGFGTGDPSSFEGNVISALLSPFKKGRKISFYRVLWRHSFVIFFVSSVIFLLTLYKFSPDFYTESNVISLMFSLTVTLILGVLLCWPFDSWSLWITNKLFVERKSKTILGVVLRIVLDVFLTVLPLLIALKLVFLIGTEILPEKGSFMLKAMNYTSMAFAVNLIGSLLITILQILILTIGIVIRITLRATKLNQHLAMVSRASEFPFSFVGLVFGISTALLTAILN